MTEPLRPDNVTNAFKILGTVALPDLAAMHGWLPPKGLQECLDEQKKSSVKASLEMLLVARQILTPSQLSTLLMEQSELGAYPLEKTSTNTKGVTMDEVKAGLGRMEKQPASGTSTGKGIVVPAAGSRAWKAWLFVTVLALSLAYGATRLRRSSEVGEHVTQAQAAMGRRNWPEARDILAKALAVDPSSEEAMKLREECTCNLELALENKSKVFAAGERIDGILEDLNAMETPLDRIAKVKIEVYKDLDAVLDANPDMAMAAFQKGRLLAIEWRFEDARKMFDLAARQDPALVAVRLEQARLGVVQLLLTERPELPAAAFKEWQAGILKNAQEALAVVMPKRTEISSPSRLSADLLQALAQFLAAPKESEAAIKILTDAYMKHHDPMVVIWLGILRLHSGDSGAARSALELGVEDRPNGLVGRMALARAYQATGQPDDALKQWIVASQIDAKNPVVIMGRAGCLERRTEFAEALKALGELAYPTARLIRARCLRQMGKSAEAIQECSTLLADQPAAAWARVERAKAKAALEKFAEAIEDLKAAGEKDAELKTRVAVLIEEYAKSQKPK